MRMNGWINQIYSPVVYKYRLENTHTHTHTHITVHICVIRYTSGGLIMLENVRTEPMKMQKATHNPQSQLTV